MSDANASTIGDSAESSRIRPFAHRAVRRRMSDDAQLRTDVLARLISDPLIRAGSIQVAADEGQVTLTGYVTDCLQKEAARRVVLSLKGVDTVFDRLFVAVLCPIAV